MSQTFTSKVYDGPHLSYDENEKPAGKSNYVYKPVLLVISQLFDCFGVDFILKWSQCSVGHPVGRDSVVPPSSSRPDVCIRKFYSVLSSHGPRSRGLLSLQEVRPISSPFTKEKKKTILTTTVLLGDSRATNKP